MLSILSPVRIKRSQPAKCRIAIMVTQAQLRLSEILFRPFFQAMTQSFALHRGTPFSWTGNIWMPTFYFFFFLGGGGWRIGGAVFLPSPSPFTLLSLCLSPLHPLFSISSFSLPSHPSPSLLHPALYRTLSKRLNDGVRGREGGIKWEWEWEMGRKKVEKREGE